MDNLEQSIQAVLQDPEQMGKIMDMVKSLGISPPEQEQPPQEQSTMPDISQLLNGPMGAMLTQAGRLDARQQNLLNAIKPFLRPGRQEKIDRAMQVARLSHLAGAALRNREQKDE